MAGHGSALASDQLKYNAKMALIHKVKVKMELGTYLRLQRVRVT